MCLVYISSMIATENFVPVWEKYDGSFIVLSGHIIPEILCYDKHIRIPIYKGSYLCSWRKVIGLYSHYFSDEGAQVSREGLYGFLGSCGGESKEYYESL